MASAKPAYIEIAERKQKALAAAIPSEWRLPAHLIPEGMLSPAESITKGPKDYGRISVMDIPRTCGILTPTELDITEQYDVRRLLNAMGGGKLKAEDVIRSFCKVRAPWVKSRTPLALMDGITHTRFLSLVVVFREQPWLTN